MRIIDFDKIRKTYDPEFLRAYMIFITIAIPCLFIGFLIAYTGNLLVIFLLLFPIIAFRRLIK